MRGPRLHRREQLVVQQGEDLLVHAVYAPLPFVSQFGININTNINLFLFLLDNLFLFVDSF